jgi:hypothetical protein
MRKRSLMLAACLAISLSVAGPARPQSPAPDVMAAARELLVTIRFIDQFKAVLPIIMQNMKAAIVQNRPQVEREFDAVMPLIVEGMNPRLNELAEQTAVIYANNFTVAELRDITAFFRAPTGEKYLRKLPEITQQSMAAGQQFGQSVAAEMHSRIVEELNKRGAR